MVAGQNQPQTLNYDECQKMTYMYIMYFIALLPVQNITKLCHYTEETSDQLYREYHRLTRTGTYKNSRSYLTFS